MELDVELAQLKDLIESPGWTLLERLVDEHHGPAAVLRDVDEQMKALKPGDFTDQHAIYTQIRAASLAAHNVLNLPKARLRQLESAATLKDKRTFPGFRRAPVSR
ncbi:MAG: hypothetical protein ABL982_03550 [Vicinamibacterales bacterium]